MRLKVYKVVNGIVYAKIGEKKVSYNMKHVNVSDDVLKSALNKKYCDDLQMFEFIPEGKEDLYKKQIDELEDELASTYDKLENAKSEVAREIFEEIYKLLFSSFTAVMPCNSRLVSLNELAELKKKYTGEK